MEPTDAKYLLDNLKLLFSSLFARQMPYLVVGCPGLADNQFIFSNVDSETMEIYESDPEYFYHLVTIKDDRLMDLLFQKYPVLKDNVLIIDLRILLALLNKTSSCFADSDLSLLQQELFFTGGGLRESCGLLSSEFTVKHYLDIYESGIPDVDDPYIVELTSDKINAVGITFVEIMSRDVTSLHAVYRSRCMLLQGKSMISTKEYLAKSKIPEYSFKLIAGGTKQAIKVMTVFENSKLEVRSTQPGIRYYAK